MVSWGQFGRGRQLSCCFSILHVMPRRDVDLVLRQIAQGQHGVVSRRQAAEVGAGWALLRTRLRAGTWTAASPGVLRLAGAPSSFEQRCIVGLLDLGRGAVVSRVTAAALWELPGFTPGQVHITRPRMATSRTSALALVHESRYLPDHHCTTRDGIPITTVARTLFDLAGCVHPGRAERALENALKYRLVVLEDLRRTTIELLSRGRAGSTLMRELLRARRAGYIPPARGLEADFLALLVVAGLELPKGQVDLGGVDWIGRVDFYYRHLRLVIEIDSDIHHTAKLDTESDERRDEALRAAGFDVMRITEAELRDHPEMVVARVRAALAGSPPRSGPSR